jgi:hypothetical protein
MIARFICWLFGHERMDKWWNGTDHYPQYTYQFFARCPRCGTNF